MIAEQLGRTGLCICPDFLVPSALSQTRADLNSVRAAGNMHRASTGQKDSQQVQQEVRHDSIYWLERQTANVVQKMLFEKLDFLRTAFNQSLYLGLNDFEGHYAAYPIGGVYKRHLDRFQRNSSRVVSFILYLNQNWLKTDGGELRIYEKDGTHTPVEPTGGTMVCFLSGESEHEVMPSLRERFSFVGWFRRVNHF